MENEEAPEIPESHIETTELQDEAPVSEEPTQSNAPETVISVSEAQPEPAVAPPGDADTPSKKDIKETESVAKSTDDKKELKDKAESVMKATTSTFRQRSSLLYKHDFSVLSISKEDAKEEEVKKALGSKGKVALGSVISIHRGSLTGDIYDKSKAARYMNTYRLESENPFNPERVEKILEFFVLEALDNLTYDHDRCAKQAKWASSAIRAAVKELKFDRYKLVCLMTIGEKNSQDVYATCRFLWDVEKDRYAVFAHENTFVYGYAQCFGLYYE